MNNAKHAVILLLLSAAPPPAEPLHFDAVERCGAAGVAEWDAYYAPDGRLHIEVWCRPEDA